MERHFSRVSLVLLAALLMPIAVPLVPACRISEFQCRNSRCIRLDRYCDGVDDCGDKSDEPRYCTGNSSEFQFKNRTWMLGCLVTKFKAMIQMNEDCAEY
ncbi:hypothetical protein C0J52_04236 [Blattella germanica]|nr:hypothetical protein C0J52_04236 [Blattella germanica]